MSPMPLLVFDLYPELSVPLAPMRPYEAQGMIKSDMLAVALLKIEKPAQKRNEVLGLLQIENTRLSQMGVQIIVHVFNIA